MTDHDQVHFLHGAFFIRQNRDLDPFSALVGCKVLDAFSQTFRFSSLFPDSLVDLKEKLVLPLSLEYIQTEVCMSRQLASRITLSTHSPAAAL